MQFIGLDLGTWADWVAAVAATAGTVLSIFAIKFALAANRTAERTRQEAKDASDASAVRERERDDRDRERARQARMRDEERDARERDRERRELAGSLTAWWAADREAEGRRYGVVVSNRSTTNAVFHDVDVRVSGFRGTEHSIHMNVVPPGQFFVQQGQSNGRSTLAKIPLPVRPSEVLDPFTVANDRSVVAIEYADSLGTRWRWTPSGGLAQVPEARP